MWDVIQMDIGIDTSALIAVIVDEPERDKIIELKTSDIGFNDWKKQHRISGFQHWRYEMHVYTYSEAQQKLAIVLE